MSLTYVVTFFSAFCRCAIGFVFLLSFVSKGRDIVQFQQTIARFRLLSKNLSNIAAILFLGSELAVVLCLLLGGELLLVGFALAFLALLVFTIALFSVLIRKLHISCNCFGASDQPVTVTDVWRNIGLIICALVGYSTTFWVQTWGQSLSIGEWLLAGVSALLLSLLWLQLNGVVQLLSGRDSSSTEHI
jgi:uncharacterized membrane protein